MIILTAFIIVIDLFFKRIHINYYYVWHKSDKGLFKSSGRAFKKGNIKQASTNMRIAY